MCQPEGIAHLVQFAARSIDRWIPNLRDRLANHELCDIQPEEPRYNKCHGHIACSPEPVNDPEHALIEGENSHLDNGDVGYPEKVSGEAKPVPKQEVIGRM